MSIHTLPIDILAAPVAHTGDTLGFLFSDLCRRLRFPVGLRPCQHFWSRTRMELRGGI